jgi:hypothetical protein
VSNNVKERLIGFDRGIRSAITWLHERAKEMNDPHARAVLNSAAFGLGTEKTMLTPTAPTPALGEEALARIEAATTRAEARIARRLERRVRPDLVRLFVGVDHLRVDDVRAILARLSARGEG